jgi:hypothetical protein
MKRISWILVVGVAAACGGHQRGRSEDIDFRCKDRVASYIATRHLGGDEIGVQMDCAEAGPRVKRWRVDKQGHRIEDAHAISPEAFERTWREIDGTGWAYLKDCTNGTLEKRDPVYVFDVKDDEQKNSFQCQTRTVPYPYNDITDPLDMLAQQGQKQLGDDEPADLKAPQVPASPGRAAPPKAVRRSVDKKDMQQ